MVDSFGNRRTSVEPDELMGEPWTPEPPPAPAPEPVPSPVGTSYIELRVRPVLDEEAMAEVCEQITDMIATAVNAGIRLAMGEDEGSPDNG